MLNLTLCEKLKGVLNFCRGFVLILLNVDSKEDV